MYGKVFESMFDGTLASKGPWQALVTFQQMIVLANKDGIIDMTPEAISRRTSIPLEIIELGIAELSKPDARSRTPDEDGRRIVLIEDHRDWGWQIVNHAKYQAIRKAEERREYLRTAQAERRARLKGEQSTPVNNVNTASEKVSTSTPEYAYVSATEAEEKTKTQQPTVAAANGVKRPRVTDHDEIIFGYGVPLLVNAGTEDKHARSFLGGLRKQHGDDALIEQLRECLKAKPLQPLEWLGAALPPKPRPGKQGALEARNAAVAKKIKDSLNAID